MSPAARDWLLFAGVLLVAFVVGGTVFGSVGEILNICSGPCAPVEQFVVLNIGAGLAVTAATAIVVLLIGRRRRSR